MSTQIEFFGGCIDCGPIELPPVYYRPTKAYQLGETAALAAAYGGIEMTAWDNLKKTECKTTIQPGAFRTSKMNADVRLVKTGVEYCGTKYAAIKFNDHISYGANVVNLAKQDVVELIDFFTALKAQL